MQDRPAIDNDTIVIFALDVDNTSSTAWIEAGKSTERSGYDQLTPPDKNLSPRLLQFIEETKAEIKETKSAAVCGGFAICTHRYGYTELSNAHKAYNQQNYAKLHHQAYGQVYIDEGNKKIATDCKETNTDHSFTCCVIDNLAEKTKLTYLGTSTPEDKHTFGEAFANLEPHYRTAIKNKSYKTSSLNGKKFNVPVYPSFPVTSSIEYKSDTKNKQLSQLAEAMAAKFPNKKILIRFVDDVKAICDNALQLTKDQLPAGVTLEVYHHNAMTQSPVDFRGKVTGMTFKERDELRIQEAKEQAALRKQELEHVNQQLQSQITAQLKLFSARRYYLFHSNAATSRKHAALMLCQKYLNDHDAQSFLSGITNSRHTAKGKGMTAQLVNKTRKLIEQERQSEDTLKIQMNKISLDT